MPSNTVIPVGQLVTDYEQIEDLKREHQTLFLEMQAGERQAIRDTADIKDALIRDVEIHDRMVDAVGNEKYQRILELKVAIESASARSQLAVGIAHATQARMWGNDLS